MMFCKPLRFAAAALLLLAACPIAARADWGRDDSCAPVGAPVVVPEWEWVPSPTDADQVHLLHRGRQVGTWRLGEHCYYPFDGRAWGSAAPPPTAAPDSPAAEENYGLDRSKISKRERCTVNGREVAKEAALGAVGDRESSLPDDADRPWLIDVGDESAGKKLDAELSAAAELSPYKSAFRRQSYRPDDLMVRDRDGRVMYPPGVYAVTAAGRPRRLLPAYTTAAELAGALRKLPPDFDPKNIPPVGPTPAPAPAPADDPTPWAVGGTLLATLTAVGYLLTRKS